jgi:hypothetical protein
MTLSPDRNIVAARLDLVSFFARRRTLGATLISNP